FERKSLGNDAPKELSGSRTTGFPLAQHRSKSAFAQRRDAKKKALDTSDLFLENTVPPSAARPTNISELQVAEDEPVDEWRAKISQENERRVMEMSYEQIMSEQRDLIDFFGEELLDKFKTRTKVKHVENSEGSLKEVPVTDERPKVVVPKPMPPALSTPGSPRSTTPRQLRFAPLNADDVHVYPSAPSSPKKAALALPPPVEGDPDTTSLGSYRVPAVPRLFEKSHTPLDDEGEMDEGSPEFIRQRYFPSHPPNEPSLQWMSPQPQTTTSMDNDSTFSSSLRGIRFDLTGTPIPEAQVETLPTHLGLHHHADPSARAGYTLDDIFLLSRSTVTNQRATMVELLTGVSRWSSSQPPNKDLVDLRKRILSVGIISLDERSPTMVIRAVDLVRSCLLDWPKIPEPTLLDRQVTIPTLLAPLAMILGRDDLPRETKSGILDILEALLVDPRLGEDVLELPGLMSAVKLEFVTSSNRSPSAISFVTNLACTSREAASKLVGSLGFTDALVPLITGSLASSDLSLVETTLHFFTTITRYGLGLRSILSNPEVALALSRLGMGAFDPSSPIDSLQRRYLDLVSTWLVCAQNPHSTTPVHSITWSNVLGWGWSDELLSFSEAEHSMTVEAALLEAAAAFQFKALFKPSLVNKVEGIVGDVERLATTTTEVELVAGYLRLALACQLLSPLAGLRNSLFDRTISAPPPSSSSQRALTTLLARAFKLEASSLPQEKQIQNGLSLFGLFRLGDENFALELLDDILAFCAAAPEWQDLGLSGAKGCETILDFLDTSLESEGHYRWKEDKEEEEDMQNQKSVILAPYRPTPASIKECTTLLISENEGFLTNKKDTLPETHPLASAPSSSSNDRISIQRLNGPQGRDHEEEVDWNPTELEIVKGCLGVAIVLMQLGLCLDRNDVLLACMKVFMLEDGALSDAGGGQEEVFRDTHVEGLMSRLLRHFNTSQKQDSQAIDVLHPSFYQFYTSFIGLYDQISFGHRLFSSLLLPPTAMDYAVDYRRLFWADYSHILRNVREVELYGADEKRWLYPVEEDGKVLGGQLRAIYSGDIKSGSFLWTIAVHHIAGNIWDKSVGNPIRASQLLRAALERCGKDALGDIIKHGITNDVERERRLGMVKDLLGSDQSERIRALIFP
ncbi:hypothetical protein DL96DRAFT_1572861, partial [Flagelloscypha sp. PMI_526]